MVLGGIVNIVFCQEFCIVRVRGLIPLNNLSCRSGEERRAGGLQVRSLHGKSAPDTQFTTCLASTISPQPFMCQLGVWGAGGQCQAPIAARASSWASREVEGQNSGKRAALSTV